MKIQMYAAGSVLTTKVAKQAGCAVVLISHGNRSARRCMAYKLGNSTYNLASLQAARLALASLRPRYYCQDTELELFVENKYVESILGRDDKNLFVIEPKSNVEVVESLREWLRRFEKVAVSQTPFEDGIGLECMIAARAAATAQRDSDSGTLEAG